jgi:hypothetical protein
MLLCHVASTIGRSEIQAEGSKKVPVRRTSAVPHRIGHRHVREEWRHLEKERAPMDVLTAFPGKPLRALGLLLRQVV